MPVTFDASVVINAAIVGASQGIGSFFVVRYVKKAIDKLEDKKEAKKKCKDDNNKAG